MNQCLYLGGPEAVSWRDVVAAFGRELHCEVPVRFAAPASPSGCRVGRRVLASTETFDSVLDTSGLARTFRVS